MTYHSHLTCDRCIADDAENKRLLAVLHDLASYADPLLESTAYVMRRKARDALGMPPSADEQEARGGWEDGDQSGSHAGSRHKDNRSS